MATYAQLQAEPWWGREIVTPEMNWLGDELCRRTGRPDAAFGSKGDNNHLRGAHRSQEWIKNSRYCTSRSYTVQSGLTATQVRHVCGADFNPGSTTQMTTQSKRIIAAMKAGRLNEVLEFFGTTDGRTVTGWSNTKNQPATADSSHLWHWHMTIDRRHCANRSLMERIAAIALGDTEGSMSTLDQDDLRKITDIVRDQVPFGLYDFAWVARNQKDYRDLPYAAVAKPTADNLHALFVAPVLAVLASQDPTAFAEAVANAVVAKLPADRDDVTVPELAEAIRSLILPADPPATQGS